MSLILSAPPWRDRKRPRAPPCAVPARLSSRLQEKKHSQASWSPANPRTVCGRLCSAEQSEVRANRGQRKEISLLSSVPFILVGSPPRPFDRDANSEARRLYNNQQRGRAKGKAGKCTRSDWPAVSVSRSPLSLPLHATLFRLPSREG